jgi:hypothetical protein
MRSFVLLALIGCSSPPAPAKPAPPPNDLSPALEPLRAMLGDWQSDDEGTLHAFAASGAIYAGAFHREQLDVLIFDDGDGPGKPDGVLRMYAVSPNIDPVAFKQDATARERVTFAAEGGGTAVAFQLGADAMTAYAIADGSEAPLAFKRATAAPAPELEAADLAFAKDTAARGVEGWLAAFEPQGMMVRRGARITGRDAIAEAMKPVFDTGTLVWAPVASRRVGPLGFTVGKATHTGTENWKSTYITLWHQQADGSWKVLLDTGRPVQE